MVASIPKNSPKATKDALKSGETKQTDHLAGADSLRRPFCAESLWVYLFEGGGETLAVPLNQLKKHQPGRTRPPPTKRNLPSGVLVVAMAAEYIMMASAVRHPHNLSFPFSVPGGRKEQLIRGKRCQEEASINHQSAPSPRTTCFQTLHEAVSHEMGLSLS